MKHVLAFFIVIALFGGCSNEEKGNNIDLADEQNVIQEFPYQLDIPLDDSSQDPAFPPNDDAIDLSDEQNVTIDLADEQNVTIDLADEQNGTIDLADEQNVTQGSPYQLDIPLDGSLQNPAFSPNGDAIVFTRFRDGYNTGASDLYIYNMGSELLSPLISDGSGNVNLPGTVWNTSLSSIVFSSARDPHDEIFMIPDTGGSEKQITKRVDRQAYEPSFSPDGEWIVFESHPVDVEKEGVITIYRVDGTSEYINLTQPSDDCRQPNWSPSGNQILYQKEENGQWDIWVMDIDGSNKTMVTSGVGDKTDAVFSHDGNWIVFSGDDTQSTFAGIHKIPATGGTATRLTPDGSYDGAPSISPDGSKIAFESYPGYPDGSAGTTLWILDVTE